MIVLRPDQLEVAQGLLTVYEGLPIVDAPIEAKVKAEPTAERRIRVNRKPTNPTTRCTVCKLPLVNLGKHMVKRHPSAA